LIKNIIQPIRKRIKNSPLKIDAKRKKKRVVTINKFFISLWGTDVSLNLLKIFLFCVLKLKLNIA
tara:strand:+ start:1108 stop:1302 length:195 start_codon:yes stop_codon:yes gene_type:complete